MFKSAVFLSAVMIYGVALSPYVSGSSQAATPASAQAPTTGSNPVKPTADSQSKAKKIYGYDCALCHGDSGNGKTDLAKDMGMTLTDWTDPAVLSGKSDAELFDLIKNGKGKMPPEDASRAKPDEVWNLVIYIRKLAKVGAAPAIQSAK